MRITRPRTAWLGLVVALAVHVVDEAVTGFLKVYNPTVQALRERLGWSPMPEFRFDVWATGLVAFVVGLALLTPLVERGPRLVRAAAVVVAGLMMLNGVAHVTGTVAGQTVPTVRFDRPMPGFWSSPLLIAAAVHFIVIVRARHRNA